MTTNLEGIAFGEHLRIERWNDPLIEEAGHDARSIYAEKFWLPVLGPSTTWLLRHFAAQLEQHPSGVVLNVSITARSLGLGERTGRHAPFLRTVARAIDFEMARSSGPGCLQIRLSLPDLARRHLLRLPESLRAEHAWLTEQDSTPTGGDPNERYRRHGRQLAIRLLSLGETESEVERQLRDWHFHPEIISDCLSNARVICALNQSSNSSALAG